MAVMALLAAFLWGLIMDVISGEIKQWISDFISPKVTRISDAFWERFLPPDYRDIMTRSASTVVFSTKKELYYSLCNSPILLDGGKMSFALDVESGKKCYMLGARELSIAWGDDADYWIWRSQPNSRFSNVAVHQSMCWLNIEGKMKRRELSPKTLYAVYLVYKIAEKSHGLAAKASVILVGAEGGGAEHEANTVYLESKPSSQLPMQRQGKGKRPKERKDGWMEIKMGEFFNYEGDDGEQVEMRLMGVEFLNRESGLVVQGIELRPNEDEADGWINSLGPFRMAAKPDSVWERFNPSDYQDIFNRSISPVFFSTKKELYFRLCDFPILLDSGKMSFALDKNSGKKCYMLGARGLSFEDYKFWKWTSQVDGRFSEVGELVGTYWLVIGGKMNTRSLSPNTIYVAYLVFKIAKESKGLKSVPLEASVRFVGARKGGAEEKSSSSVYLEPETSSDVETEHEGQVPRERKDGWMEIEIGEFFNNQGEDGEVEMRLMEVEQFDKKSGVVVQGIELRPKADDGTDGWITSLWRFKFEYESDTMWKRFLPSDYPEIVTRSDTPIVFSTNKELFDHLCNSPILLDGGKMSFAIDKRSGRKCYMLGARTLSISWGDNINYWQWTSHPDSRFSEVARLVHVFWLEIRGKMNTRMLSPKTNYAVYLVFKIAAKFAGLESIPIKALVRLVPARKGGAKVSTIYLKTAERSSHVHVRQLPRERDDGWMETEMGEHFNDGGDGELDMRFMEVELLNPKSGLIVQGIELRPRNSA